MTGLAIYFLSAEAIESKKKDAPNHRSHNAGWAGWFAVALNIRLSGPEIMTAVLLIILD